MFEQIIFLLPRSQSRGQVSEAVFGHREVKRHPRVALVQSLGGNSARDQEETAEVSKWIFESYNIYRGHIELSVFSGRNNEISSLFPDRNMEVLLLYFGVVKLNLIFTFLCSLPKKPCYRAELFQSASCRTATGEQRTICQMPLTQGMNGVFWNVEHRRKFQEIPCRKMYGGHTGADVWALEEACKVTLITICKSNSNIFRQNNEQGLELQPRVLQPS